MNTWLHEGPPTQAECEFALLHRCVLNNSNRQLARKCCHLNDSAWEWSYDVLPNLPDLPSLFIAPDGTIRAVACNDLEAIAREVGTVTTRRASHVLPCHPFKRFAFRLIRFAVGERGRLAEWCRQWRGPWQVRFADDPRQVVFTHPSRRECINWEVQTINQGFSAL